jgi:hypothetical protein
METEPVRLALMSQRGKLQNDPRQTHLLEIEPDNGLS